MNKEMKIVLTRIIFRVIAGMAILFLFGLYPNLSAASPAVNPSIDKDFCDNLLIQVKDGNIAKVRDGYTIIFEKWRKNSLSDQEIKSIDPFMNELCQKAMKYDWDTFIRSNENGERKYEINTYVMALIALGVKIGQQDALKFDEYINNLSIQGRIKAIIVDSWTKLLSDLDQEKLSILVKNRLEQKPNDLLTYVSTILNDESFCSDATAFEVVIGISNSPHILREMKKNRTDCERILPIINSKISIDSPTLSRDKKTIIQIALIKIYAGLSSEIEFAEWKKALLAGNQLTPKARETLLMLLSKYDIDGEK